MSTTLPVVTASDTTWRNAVSISTSSPTMGCVGAAPSELDRNGLEKRQIVPEPQRLGRGHGKREGLRGHAGMVHEPVRQVHGNSAKQVLQRLHDCFDFRLVRAGVQRLPPRAAVQQLVEDLDLLLQQ